jgi:Mrp family chromosome partitioning ATPase
LVLPPDENPTPLGPEENTPDPVLASANQAWEQQIRAHEVPGFAVVKPGSEPPPPLVARAEPSEPPEPPLPPLPVRSSSSGPPPAATIQRTISRPPNPMKVTQPLGSFVQEALLEAQRRGEIVSTRPSLPPRSSSPPPVSQYSYVSTAPPSSSSMPAAPRSTPVRVQSVPASWRPDPSLTPQAQRGLCEQLVPFAVESCFVLAVVSVPEAIGYKSRVASEIALGLAESGHPRVLLLEGDLQRPWVQRMIGVDMPIATGFSQQLNARALGGQDTRWTVLGCTKSLHVLAEGMMRAPGLLLSKHFAACLRELRVYYDFIIIDGPSTSLDVDSGALDAVTDGIVTVCPAKGSPALAHMSSLFGKKRFSAFASSG